MERRYGTAPPLLQFSPPSSPRVRLQARARSPCVRASDGAHVFMHSGAPVQLVTLAQRVAPRNTADVQMFLLGKQTEQRPFYSGQRACQNKSGPPRPGPLLRGGDPLARGQMTVRPLAQVCFAGCLSNLHTDV